MSQAVKYTIDPAHSTAGFKVRHLMVSNVRGEFSGIAGTVEFDPGAPENSRVEARIDATTIHSRDEQRDAHLKSADFLDVAKFPEITFVSRKIKGGGEVTLDVEGPAPEAKDPWGNMKTGATAVTKISRKEFGMEFNMVLETGGVMVGDEITITLEVELLRG
jgi:polyisoprenoid-binding protein YceI